MAFVSAPGTARDPVIEPAAAGLLGALAPAGAVLAELPPLEELPLDEIAGKKPEAELTWFGISFPMAASAIFVAMCWAAVWVANLKPKRDEEGKYRTYIGGGELPPEGYTNPLDVRLADEDEEEETK